MSPRRKILEALKEAGFSYIRTGKHEIYTNGKWNVTVPSGNNISGTTLKATLQSIEGRGPFFRKAMEQTKRERIETTLCELAASTKERDS